MASKAVRLIKICWYCKGKMEAKDAYFQCIECGATHVPCVKPGPPLFREQELYDPIYGAIHTFFVPL